MEQNETNLVNPDWDGFWPVDHAGIQGFETFGGANPQLDRIVHLNPHSTPNQNPHSNPGNDYSIAIDQSKFCRLNIRQYNSHHLHLYHRCRHHYFHQIYITLL